jgi:chromosome segregation ATPase
MGTVACPHCGGHVTQDGKAPEESQPAAEPATESTPAAAESGELQVKVDALTAQVSTFEQSIAQLTVERDGAVLQADTDKATIQSLTSERDELAARVKQLEADQAASLSELKEAQQKLEALQAGQAPVSSVPGEGIEAGSLMERARKAKK